MSANLRRTSRLWWEKNEQTDGGGLTVYVLLSLVNKETALAFDRTAAQIGGVNKTKCWEKEGSEADAMQLAPRSDMLNISR